MPRNVPRRVALVLAALAVACPVLGAAPASPARAGTLHYPDVWITLSPDRSYVRPGETVRLTVRYGNRGPETAQDVTVTDLSNPVLLVEKQPLPVGWWASPPGYPSPLHYQTQPDNNSPGGPPIAPGEVRSFTLLVRLDPRFTSGSFTAGLWIGSFGGDEDPSNDRGYAEVVSCGRIGADHPYPEPDCLTPAERAAETAWLRAHGRAPLPNSAPAKVRSTPRAASASILPRATRSPSTPSTTTSAGPASNGAVASGPGSTGLTSSGASSSGPASAASRVEALGDVERTSTAAPWQSWPVVVLVAAACAGSGVASFTAVRRRRTGRGARKAQG